MTQVGQTRYTAPLGPDDQFGSGIATTQGHVGQTHRSVLGTGGWALKPVARYDCAHGHPHRDLVDADGNVIDKLGSPAGRLAQALDHAIMDIKAHWPRYRADFLGRLP